MAESISWTMTYHSRKQNSRDRVGGLPDHLPLTWPRCQLCQSHMQFVGQLYASDRLELPNLLGIQFYICDDCRETFSGANDRLPIQMEMLSTASIENKSRRGVRCSRQPKKHVKYTPVKDPMDQNTFRRKSNQIEHPMDAYLYEDKVGGLFPYDGYETPKITQANQMLAQFMWSGIGGPIYLYNNRKSGIYFYHYR